MLLQLYSDYLGMSLYFLDTEQGIIYQFESVSKKWKVDNDAYIIKLNNLIYQNNKLVQTRPIMLYNRDIGYYPSTPENTSELLRQV